MTSAMQVYPICPESILRSYIDYLLLCSSRCGYNFCATNYGVPDISIIDEMGLPEYFESDNIHITGLVVSCYSLDQMIFCIPGVRCYKASELGSDTFREQIVNAIPGRVMIYK